MLVHSTLRQPWENQSNYSADPYLNFKNILFCNLNYDGGKLNI